jgi:hypothetical protein
MSQPVSTEQWMRILDFAAALQKISSLYGVCLVRGPSESEIDKPVPLCLVEPGSSEGTYHQLLCGGLQWYAQETHEGTKVVVILHAVNADGTPRRDLPVTYWVDGMPVSGFFSLVKDLPLAD